VARWTLQGDAGDGAWRPLARGTTIGHARLVRFARTPLRRVRLMVEDAIRAPEPVTMRLYDGGD
jgi:hypothetical protein